MFTTKIESSNCCAMIAVSPSATMIETMAISSGMRPATTAPKTSSRMMSAREPELELAVLEILLREQVEVVVERALAGDRDGECRVLVGRLERLDDSLRLVVVGDRDRDEGRVPIGGDRGLRGRVT